MIYKYCGNSSKGGIYRIRNTINHRYYIGSAKCFKNRWSAHMTSLRHNKHHSKFLQHDYNKLVNECGNDDFLVFEILEIIEGDKVTRERAEQIYINEAFASKGTKCYNMSKVATANEGLFGPDNSFFGKTHTDETKKYLSYISKQRTGDKNPNYGNRWTEKMKDVMRGKVKERIKDPAYREKLSNAQRNKVLTEEQKNISSEKKRQAMQILYQNEEFRQKMIEVNKIHNIGEKSKRSVQQFTKDGEYITTFMSIKEAAEFVGVSTSCISECCNGKQKTAAGYKWSYTIKDNS
jgi:group I intron endonuclease